MEPKNTISSSIKNRIETFKEGYIFTYLEFEDASKNREAIIKSLNRLVEKGIIDKLAKGKFYKPTKSEYGRLGPDVNEIVKDLLVSKGEVIGYITGFSIFNKYGLTTQISNTIQIGRNTFKPPLKRGIYSIQFILQKNLITKENVKVLEVLDCLKMIKGIPDANKDNTLTIIGKSIRKFNKEQRDLLIQCSLKYNASTRALLGIVLDMEKIKKGIDDIMESLNPASKYNLDLNKIDRLLKDKWNIK